MGKILLVVVVFAALVYLGFWLWERRRTKKAGLNRPTQAPPRRMAAPDDDPDFLRELERRRRRAAREEQNRPSESDEDQSKPE